MSCVKTCVIEKQSDWFMCVLYSVCYPNWWWFVIMWCSRPSTQTHTCHTHTHLLPSAALGPSYTHSICQGEPISWELLGSDRQEEKIKAVTWASDAGGICISLWNSGKVKDPLSSRRRLWERKSIPATRENHHE